MNAEPFSFSVLAVDIPAEGRRYELEADGEQRAGLAALLQIPAVDALKADIDVRPARGGGFSLRGSLTASVTQTDVVSLEPSSQAVAEEIDVTLIPAERRTPRRRADQGLVDAEAADGPDLYRNGRIDLGIVVREHLALGLDPYPRAPGAVFPGHVEDSPADDPSPFAALSALKAPGE